MRAMSIDLSYIYNMLGLQLKEETPLESNAVLFHGMYCANEERLLSQQLLCTDFYKVNDFMQCTL